MRRAHLARRTRARTLCRTAPRSTSARARLETFRGACFVKRSSEAGAEGVGGGGVHAGEDDGQYLPALLGHDGRGLDEGRLGGNGGHSFRHYLANGDAGTFEGLPTVLLRAPERHEAAEDVEEAR